MEWNLTEGLAAVGAVVLAGVLAHGWWRARQASPRQARPPHNGRLEPQLDMLDGDLSGVARTADAEADSQPSATPAGERPPARSPLPPRKTARLDPLIDAMATLTLEQPVSGDLAQAHLPTSRRAGSKPFIIEGCLADGGEPAAADTPAAAATADAAEPDAAPAPAAAGAAGGVAARVAEVADAHGQHWELPQPGRRYRAFQAGVQLANRSGACSEIEYSEFIQKLQGFAEGVGAMVDAPDMRDVVQRARELDQFASAHDAQLSLLLLANSAAWSVGYLQQAAGRHGFVPGQLPGRLVLPSAEEGAPPMLVLSFDAQAALADDPNAASVRQVQLSLDVPQTPETDEPFPAWQDAARRLAAELDATVCDDDGRALPLAAFVSIGEDLKALYQALEQRDLAAGSPAARRLFS